MKSFFNWALIITSVCMLASCHSHNDQHNHEHEGHDHEQNESHEGHEGHDHEQNEGHEGHEGHEDHEHSTPLQLSGYNADFECFAETQAFVQNQEVVLNTHLTRLDNFKPLANAKVSAVMTINGKAIKSSKTSSSQAGIYKITILPTLIGDAQLSIHITREGLENQIIEIPTKVFDCEHEAHEYAESLEVTSSNAVSFTKEKSWYTDFATTPVVRENFGKVIHTVGAIQPAQGARRILTAKADGIINFASLALTEGQKVQGNKTLFTLDGETMADNNMSVKYTNAEANYQQAKIEYERKQKLVAQKIVSRSELLQVKTNYIQAESIYLNLKKNFSAKGQRIYAPFTGYISQIYVHDGEFVTTGQKILSIAQNNFLFIKAQVPARYYSYLETIEDATFIFDGDTKIYSLKELNGQVLSYSKTTNVNNPLLSITFKVENPHKVLAGGFVNINIQSVGQKASILVAKTALIEELGNYFVYVQLTPEYFEKRLVKIGESNGIQTVIYSGLTQGERVVSKGAVLVKLAQSAGSVDPHAGHNH